MYHNGRFRLILSKTMKPLGLETYKLSLYFWIVLQFLREKTTRHNFRTIFWGSGHSAYCVNFEDLFDERLNITFDRSTTTINIWKSTSEERVSRTLVSTQTLIVDTNYTKYKVTFKFQLNGLLSEYKGLSTS